jgi:DNA-binding response OmpR family regulator
MSEPGIKILIIEDEPTVRLGLEDNLALEGYKIIACENGVEGLEAFKKESPELVILDLMMPGMDGLEVCRQVRALRPSTLIIMLTARASEVDKVVGLELGADDYLTKPYHPRELIARIKALLRRVSVQQEAAGSQNGDKGLQELKFGDVVVDFKTYRAQKGGAEILLSAKEYDLIRFLASQPDVPVTRDQLLDQVWGYNSYPTTRTVDNFIARLRQKVEDSPERPRHILTVHGVGYKFVF